MRTRSRKTQAEYRLRRSVVAAQLAEEPICQRCWQALATEVHEPETRARGGSITDRANTRSLCHRCHRWVHDNTGKATEQGWLVVPTVHDFVSDDGIYCTKCSLLRANWRHGHVKEVR